jgi:phage shock protein B
MELATALMIPTVVFMVHYRSKRQHGSALSDREQAELDALADIADQLSERVRTLEAILDSEVPSWRAPERES